MKEYYNRSKNRILISVIILSILLFITGRYKADFSVKQYVMNFFHPLFSYTHSAVEKTQKVFFSLFHFYSLGKSNEQLTRQMEELQNKLLETEEIRKENDRLNELLQFKSQLKFRVVPAKIIGHDSSNWKKSILINKGREDGVLTHHAVICPKGIVGKIVESFDHNAKVMLIIDNDSQVGGMILRTRDIGVLYGRDKDICLLNYLSRNADIKKGDLVITSGFDGFFPKGVILGEVEKVYSEDFGLYKYAEIVPAVDFNKLEEVLVIKTHLAPKQN